MQEKYQRSEQNKVKNRNNLCKNVCKTNKELGERVCEKCSKQLGERVWKKVRKEIRAKYARKE